METSLPIKQAAYESGFCGNGGLARAFRRHIGIPPGEYRRIFAAR
jgi:AraC-like DNA-binding protein